MTTRRQFVSSATILAVYAGASSLFSSPAFAAADDLSPAALPKGAREGALLDTLPGKKPLIKVKSF